MMDGEYLTSTTDVRGGSQTVHEMSVSREALLELLGIPADHTSLVVHLSESGLWATWTVEE